MIINNVLLKLKNRDEYIITKVQTALLSMKERIDVLQDIKVELNILPSASSYDLLLITKFNSLEDIDAYLVHPVHQEVSNYIVNVLDELASLCYENK